jgi:hypothetical protein
MAQRGIMECKARRVMTEHRGSVVYRVYKVK